VPKTISGKLLISFGWALGQPFECPYPGAAAMNDKAASGSYFTIGEIGMRPVLGIASGSNVMSSSSK
jgi:hypothetical protein